MSAYTDNLAAAARAEYARWNNGAGREAENPFSEFVGEYWRSIGINNLKGKTLQNGIRPAWSSAFVSFCVRKGGAANRFKYTQAHCHYVKAAMDAADAVGNHGYVARKYESYRPKVGDVIVGGREYAKGFSYEQAKMVYIADTFYPSHGDIVVGIAADDSYVETLGGNVSNNVGRKRLPLKSNGTLQKRRVGSTEYPWIAVLECVL